MGKKSRVKGRLWEQTVARMLRPIFGESIKRGWQSRAGSDAPDVDGAPIWVECKHGATTSTANPYKAIKQAAEAAAGRKPVVAFCKVGAQARSAQRHAPIMSVPLDFGLELLAAWWHEKNRRGFNEFVAAERRRGIADSEGDEDDEPDPLAETPSEPEITAEMPVLTPPPVADLAAPSQGSPARAGRAVRAPGAPGVPGAPVLPGLPPLPPGRGGG